MIEVGMVTGSALKAQGMLLKRMSGQTFEDDDSLDLDSYASSSKIDASKHLATPESDRRIRWAKYAHRMVEGSGISIRCVELSKYFC